MGLESATYIQDLVSTNPIGTDQKSQGDDHIRLIKAVLKATFPTATAALSFGGWATKDSGFLSKSADYNQLASDDGKAIYFDCSGAARTYNLLAAATAGDGFLVRIKKDTSANSLTIDPAGAELVDGAATLVLGPNAAGMLVCTGSAWRFFGGGNVQGPASATDGAVVLWDGASGNKIKNGIAPGSSGNVLTSTGSAWASSAPASSGLSAASQAEMEAGSSIAVAATPGRTQFHPAVPKFWALINGANGATIASYNVTSTSRSSTGIFVVTIATDFSSANWAPVVTIGSPMGGGSNAVCVGFTSKAAGSITVQCEGNNGSVRDPDFLIVAGFGDQ